MKKMLAAITVNKGCCSYQAITLQWCRWWALRKLRIETGCPPSSSQPFHPTQQCTLRRLRMRKHRLLGPDSWGAYKRNDFNELRLLHLPIHRKALNSLTWNVWFSLINSNLSMFRLPGLCCKTPMYPGSSLTSLEQPLRAICEAGLLDLKSSECAPNQTQLSTFRLCIFFSVDSSNWSAFISEWYILDISPLTVMSLDAKIRLSKNGSVILIWVVWTTLVERNCLPLLTESM